ncbi:Conserved_hypothetical protein [Hexamita inflata]|uniref:Uncharacterized protein n=1 Tax=Hexamita inflata TaxID=28002 RepID=A0ABP1GS46_9EUKA
MLHLCIQNYTSLYSNMYSLENEIFDIVNDKNVFNLIEQQIDDPQTMYYDPKIFLRPSSYQNEELLQLFNISYSDTLQQASIKLQNVLNNDEYSLDLKQKAQKLIQLLLNDNNDLQYFFNNQYTFINEHLGKFSRFFDSLKNFNKSYLQSINYTLGTSTNKFQYIIDGQKSSNYNLHFTNPIPLQKLTKDILIIINNFTDSESVLITIKEAATVYDRLWFFKISGMNKYINIALELFGYQFLSLQATLNNFPQIAKMIKEGKYELEFVDYFVLQYMLDSVVIASYGAQFIVNQEGKSTQYWYEALIFAFGQWNFIKTDLRTALGNLHLFYITTMFKQFNEQNTVNSTYIYHIDYNNQEDYMTKKLPNMIQILNSLYASTSDLIGSVNDSIVIARALYKNNEYFGMLIINTKMFETFSDIILYNMDGLSACTIKMRMMDQQIPILNPFYQFSPTISYLEGKPEPLIQTIPTNLNKFPQVEFNDITSVNVVVVHKVINDKLNLYTERLYQYYQMQIVRKDLSINIGLSSTAITTKQRYQYSNNQICLSQQPQTFVIQQLNLTNLRQLTRKPFKISRQNCLITDLDSCMFKNDVELFRKTKQVIKSQINSNIECIKAENFSSKQSKFTLNMDTDDILIQLQNVQEFGNISLLQHDHDEFKNAIININQTTIDGIIQKYSQLFPQKIQQLQNIDSCVMVIENNQYKSSQNFNSLRGQLTTSPNLIQLLQQKQREVLHFMKYVNQLEYLTNIPQIKGVYLGHNWISALDYNFDDLVDLQTFVENQIGENPDQKVVNTVCSQISRLYFNSYFIFSTNSKNNEIVKSEHFKSNMNGANQKFRLSYINGQTYLTKPLISKNKSLLEIPQISGYLTLQLDIGDIFCKILGNDTKYLIMDATGSLVYSQQDTDLYAFGIKQLLIQYGYLTEILINSTKQSIQKTYGTNLKFWETAYEKSQNNDFIVMVNQNITRINSVLTQEDYNLSAVYERSVVFNASSKFFQSGNIIIKEFSVLNEYIVIIDDLVLTNFTQIIWEETYQSNLTQYLNNIPHNISALNQIYPDLTSRSSYIPQYIDRYVSTVYYNDQIDFKWLLLILTSQILLAYVILLQNKQLTFKQMYTKFNEPYDLVIEQNLLNQIFDQSQRNSQNNFDYSFCNRSTKTFPSFVQQQNIRKYFMQFQYLVKMQKIHYIFTEKQISILDQQRLEIFFDDIETNMFLFKILYIMPLQQYFRSFTIFPNQGPISAQQIYSHFLMRLQNSPSWIPNELAIFKSDLQLLKSQRIYYIPSKRYITINQKNVSKLVTRLQTAIQSSAQSRIHSKPISRQEYIEELADIPFWFNDEYIIRNNPSQSEKQQIDFKINLGLSTLSAEQMIKYAINVK